MLYVMLYIHMHISGEWCRWRLEGGEYLRSVHGTYLTALTDGHFRCDAKGTWGKFDVVQVWRVYIYYVTWDT